MTAAFQSGKTTFIFPAAEALDLFYNSTKTFINSSQTKICFVLNWLGQWTNFVTTVQIRWNFIDLCG